MRFDDIEILDLYENDHIDSHTPIIVLTIPKRYLINIYKNVYEVDILKIRNNIERKMVFINLFFPMGQVRINDDSKYHEVLLANKNIFPLSNKYKQIKKNIWIAHLNDSLSIGTIISNQKPNYLTPVVPKKLLVKTNEYNYNVYSDPSYGNYVINKYSLGINNNKVRIISVDGDISSLNIPVSSNDIISDSISGNYNFDKKIFFSTQGEIKMNSNCLHPYDNLGKFSQDECNATTYNIEPMSNTSLDDNEKVSNIDMIYSKKSKNKKGRKVILRETSEPWFNDIDIMGKNHAHDLSHKITSSNIILDLTSTSDDESNIIVKPKEKMRNMESDLDSNYSDPNYDCKDNKVIAYSQLDQLHKCDMGNQINNPNYNSDGFIEGFSESYFDQQTIIIMIILLIIIIIISYKC